jgi:hypothetical protein
MDGFTARPKPGKVDVRMGNEMEFTGVWRVILLNCHSLASSFSINFNDYVRYSA